MLGNWSEPDVRTFAALLQRFTDEFENANHHWLAERVVTHRPADAAN